MIHVPLSIYGAPPSLINAYLDLPLRDPLLLLVSGLNKTGHDIINKAPFYSSAYKS